MIDPAVGTGVVQATRNADGTCTQTGTFAVGTTNVPGTGLLVCDGSKGNFNDTNSFTQGGKEESPVTTCAFGSLDSGIPCKRSTDCATLNPLCTSSGNPFPCCAGNGTGTCTNGTCGINSTTAWIIANGGSPKKGDLAEVYLYAKVGESALDDKVCSSSSGSNAGKFCQTDSDCGTGTCAANPKDQQKDDLFLFADLTRLDVNGDMHADFEFNQRTQGSCGDTDGTTFCQTRLDGDIILSFDLAMGGASPTINIFQFKKTLASGQTCANAPQVSPPCYVLLPPPATPPGTPLATFGALNSQVIPAPPWDSVGCESVDVCSNNPNVTCTSDRNCSGGGFCGPTGCGLRSRIPSFGNMEGFVDLRSFIPNLSLCPGFAQVQVKTRSSPSLNASLLDTTSAIKINLSVCGSIIVKKVGADGVTLLPDAGFTFNPNPSDPTAGPIEVRDGDTADHACSTVGGSVVCDDGTVCLDNVLFSSQGITYSITETTVPPGFVQPTCTKDSDCAGFCGTQTTCSCDTTSGRCAGRVTVSQASTCADRLQRNEADFTFTNLRPDASIQISPPAATNEVGNPHTLTGHVNVSSGSGFVNAKDGTVIKFVKVSGPGTLSASSCTTSGGTGSCSVTLISSTAGTTVVKATTDVSVIGFLLHRETDGMARNSGPAMKTFVDATIAIGPSATNAVGANHTFAVTVKADDGSGSGPQPVSGVKPTVTLASANGATATNVTDTCASSGTNASGQCAITFTSNSGGTVTGTASVTLSVGGISLTRTTNGQSGSSGPAVKTFVDASVAIGPSATNAVGASHTFTVTVKANDGSGSGPQPVSGVKPTVTLASANGATATNVTDTCASTGTNASGQCTVTFTSNSGGTVTGTASVTLSVGGVSLTRTTNGQSGNSGPAVKTFVDATIAIAPSATNGIGDNHTFTVTVKADDGSGSGPQPVGGVKPAVTLTSANGATATNITDTCASSGTSTSGQCTVTFTSNSGGTVTGTASVTLSVGGVSLTRTTNGQSGNSGPAVKTFVAGSLRWLKKDNSGKLLGGATFQVCRTADRFGNTISPAQCQTVVDNNSPDADSGAGVFQLNNLVLGTYMIQETKPPLFYTGDSFIETTIQLTLTSPNGTATHVWVNAPFGPCVIGYPTGKAPALSSVPFNESEVLRTFGVVTSGGKVVGPAAGANSAVPATLNDKVALWYNDEHALTLGVRQVVVNGGTSPGTTNYPFSNFSAYSSALHAASPMVGSTIMSGAQAGTDLALYNTTYGFLIDRQPWNGRPMWPAVFITDITNNPNDTSGDWQQGGTSGVPPSDVFGTWKGAVRTVDKTKVPAAITVATDGDPAKNDTLGNARIDGGDIPPGPNGKGFSDSYPTPAGNKTFNEGYTAEARWDLSALGLQAGHAYRLQFMDHDGDQNKTGGDSGENCVNVLVSP